MEADYLFWREPKGNVGEPRKVGLFSLANTFPNKIRRSKVLSDTEYRLRIKTILHSKLEVESGEFRFRTPRIGVSPTAKLDVIYSSEDPSIRLQWVLAP